MGIIVNQKRLDKQGLDAVLHDTTLNGDGNTGSPLSVVEQKVSLNDNESGDLPLLNDETVSQKLQEFYDLCKWLKNHMIATTNYWPNILFSDIKSGDKLSWAGQATGYGIAPLTEYDRNGWEVITDNSQQGGAGAEGIYRLIYNSDTDWFVEGKSWHEGNFNTLLQYSPNPPGYEQLGAFDGNGGIVSINGDLSNSSVAKVLNAELEYLNIDFRGLLDIVCNIISNQTIGGIKTFKYSPQVPTPHNPKDAVNKEYVDSNSGVDDGILKCFSAGMTSQLFNIIPTQEIPIKRAIVFMYNDGDYIGEYGVSVRFFDNSDNDNNFVSDYLEQQIDVDMRYCRSLKMEFEVINSVMFVTSYYRDVNDNTFHADNIAVKLNSDCYRIQLYGNSR